MPAKPREDDMASAMLLKLHERLSAADVKLLERCWSRQDVDLVTTPPPRVHQVAWLIHFKLIVTRIDLTDRVWIETTALGRDLVVHMRKISTRAAAT